jgi:muconolactone delta-isomerase
MLTILLLLALFGAVIAVAVFWSLWRRELAARKQERWWRFVAEWRFVALKDAVETECQDKVLATLRLRIRWIENPPPLHPVAPQQEK